MLVWVGIGLLGSAGAASRFLLDGVVGRRLGRSFPYGTLIVNVSGALVLGIVVGAALSADENRLAGTGLVGAYTTFSTWMLESYRLAEDGEFAAGLRNILVSLAVGVAAALLGRQIGGAL
jgi:CrcB protein